MKNVNFEIRNCILKTDKIYCVAVFLKRGLDFFTLTVNLRSLKKNRELMTQGAERQPPEPLLFCVTFRYAALASVFKPT